MKRRELFCRRILSKDYRQGVVKTLVKTYFRSECKFHTDMNGSLPPELLIALGVMHQIRYY